VWRSLHRALLGEIGLADLFDWSSTCLDSPSVAAQRGERTGLNTLDRGRPGTKWHIVTDAGGVPLAVALTGANRHDPKVLEELADYIPSVETARGWSRSRPDKLHAHKGYDYPHCREDLRQRGISTRIARRGVESNERLGRHRWVVERSFAWISGHRQLAVRYERRADVHEAFLLLVCSFVCLRLPLCLRL
jgi:transposase